MKTAMTRVMYLLGLGYLGLHIGMASPALANNECRNSTLKGTYIFTQNGWDLAEGGQSPFAYAGQEVYDGRGNFRGINTLNTGGDVEEFATYTGTYTVQPDCTVVWEADDESEYNLFLSPRGDEFTFVGIEPEGVVGAGVARRVNR